MDLRQLRYFQTIAEMGSITRSAEALYVAQPALSQQMAKLENELGVRLFDRSVHGVTTTAAGDTLYRLTKPFLRQAETIAASVAEQRHYVAGRIAIGIPGSTGKILATTLVREMKRYPGILLEIIERPSADLVDLVARGQVDMVIAVDAPRRKDIVSTPVLLEELYVVRPASMAGGTVIELMELAAQPLVLPSLPSTIRQRIDAAFLEAHLTFELVCEPSSTDMAIRFVTAGLGWTVLPWSAISAEVEEQRVAMVRIKNQRMERQLSLCVARGSPQSHAVEIVRERLLALIDVMVRDDRWYGTRLVQS